MRSTFVSLTCGLALTVTLERVADAGTILVFGDHVARAEAGARLTEAGHAVVVAGALPADLTPYDAIWHVGATTVFDAAEQDRMIALLKAGRGVFLTGEFTCCEVMNRSLEELVHRVVRSPAVPPTGIEIGGLGTGTSGTHAFNPTAVGDVSVRPIDLVEWWPAASGRIAGIGAEHALTVDGEGFATGAVWASDDLVPGGQLVVMMDSDWYNRPNALEITTNLATFLIGGAPAAISKPEIEDLTSGTVSLGEPGAVTGHELTDPSGEAGGVDADPAAGCSVGGGGGPGAIGLLAALTLVRRSRRRRITPQR